MISDKQVAGKLDAAASRAVAALGLGHTAPGRVLTLMCALAADGRPLSFGLDDVPRSVLGFLLALGLIEDSAHTGGYRLAIVVNGDNVRWKNFAF